MNDLTETEKQQINQRTTRELLDICAKFELDAASYIPALMEAYRAGFKLADDEYQKEYRKMWEGDDHDN